MDIRIDPNQSLTELQLTLFMAAMTALVELAKTTDKDHIKLRALTEVARLCAPKDRTPLQRSSASGTGGERAIGFAPSPTPSMPSSSSAPAPTPPPRSTPSSSLHDGSATSSSSCSTPTLNRQQRRFLARMEANERKRERRRHAA